MRGALAACAGWAKPSRIIPADAGSTWASEQVTVYRGDHPRGCGEHCFSGSGRPSLSGSSPRMRGALGSGCAIAAPGGIIPADAGSTTYPTSDSGRAWDHPRGCGEHTQYSFTPVLLGGSSPRMRGAPSEPGNVASDVGIIPADAGSTVVFNGP